MYAAPSNGVIDDSDGDGVADIDEIDHENNTGGDEEADCDPDDGAEVCDLPDTATPSTSTRTTTATARGMHRQRYVGERIVVEAALAQVGPSWIREQRKPGELGRDGSAPAPATW